MVGVQPHLDHSIQIIHAQHRLASRHHRGDKSKSPLFCTLVISEGLKRLVLITQKGEGVGINWDPNPVPEVVQACRVFRPSDQEGKSSSAWLDRNPDAAAPLQDWIWTPKPLCTHHNCTSTCRRLELMLRNVFFLRREGDD